MVRRERRGRCFLSTSLAQGGGIGKEFPRVGPFGDALAGGLVAVPISDRLSRGRRRVRWDAVERGIPATTGELRTRTNCRIRVWTGGWPSVTVSASVNGAGG